MRLASERREVEAFCTGVLGPALESIRHELEQYGRTVSIERTRNTYHLAVQHGHGLEFDYSIKACRKRRRRWLYDFAGEVAVEYGSAVDLTYGLRDIRRIDRRKIVAHIMGAYRRRLKAS